MDVNDLHSETEPFGKDDLHEMVVSNKIQMKPICAEDCSYYRAKRSKWRFVTLCLKFIALVAVVFAVLLLAHSVNNLGNKLKEGREQTEHGQHVSVPQALKGSRLGLSLLNGNSPIQRENYGGSNSVDQSEPRASIPDLDVKQGPTDDEAYLKHYFDIGMKEDSMMQDCQNPNMKRSFPDIEYAFLGYDIFQGFPLADGHDPGFAYPIFAADYSHGHMTADCRYSVPKGFVVLPDVSCVTSFSSDTIQNTEELSRSLSFNAGVNGGGFGVAFSASTGFKQVTQDLNSHESMYIISTAHCNYYISKFKKENPPPFSQMFLEWIHKLNNSTDNERVFDFFDTFGTHFAKEVSFGARFSYQHKMKSSLFKTKSENGMNVAAQASYNGIFSVGGGFSLTKEQREEASEFSKSVETKTITVGAAPPSNGDAMTWASTVQDNPVPSEYKLEPIESLFHEQYMIHLNIDFKRIASKLENLKMKYYNSLVAKKYKVEIENQSHRWVTKTLTLDSESKYGTWQSPQFCPVGTFAKGFSLKDLDLNARTLDDISIQGVRLLCVDKLGQPPKNNKTYIQSPEGDKGLWTSQKLCPQGTSRSTLFLQKVALKIQEKENTRNVSVNGLCFSCRDLTWTKHSYTNSPFAEMITTWSETCPRESAICGVQTHIEKRESSDMVNDIRFYCCGDDSAYLDGGVIL